MKIALLDFTCFSRFYFHPLCNALSQRGNEVVVYGRPLRNNEQLSDNEYTYKEIMFRLGERVESLGGPRIFRRLTKGLEYFPSLISLFRDLKRFQPDVIHFLWILIPVFDIWLINRLQKKSALVLSVQDTRLQFGSDVPKVFAWKRRKAFRLFKHLIVQSEPAKQTLVSKGLPAENINIIPNGIPKPLRLSECEADAGAIKNEFKKESEKVILFFGSLEPPKGVDLLIKAFAKINPDLRNRTVLWIAGVPNMAVEELKSLARRLNVDSRINWTLRLILDHEIPWLYDTADVSVFPYDYTDSSNALLTSFIYGKPLVATDEGIFSEHIQDGVHGYLFPHRDLEALANALEKVLADKDRSKRMGEEVLKLADTIPCWDEIALEMMKVYELAATQNR